MYFGSSEKRVKKIMLAKSLLPTYYHLIIYWTDLHIRKIRTPPPPEYPYQSSRNLPPNFFFSQLAFFLGKLRIAPAWHPDSSPVRCVFSWRWSSLSPPRHDVRERARQSSGQYDLLFTETKIMDRDHLHHSMLVSKNKQRIKFSFLLHI